MLYIVATPIGNLEDITYRAVKTLKDVDLIACEDTRTSGVLLSHYDIKTPKISFHSYSKNNKVDIIINKLLEGQNIALISDAGTPGISDPGYRLVNAAIEKGITVTSIPGPSAAITALVASGFASHHFMYIGFLPIKKGRHTLLTKLSENIDQTIIMYESVHRFTKTLQDIYKYFGEDIRICIGRELTKKFESYIRGTITEVISHYENNPGEIKGEFVILISK